MFLLVEYRWDMDTILMFVVCVTYKQVSSKHIG